MNYQESQKAILLQKFSNIHEVTTPIITTTQFKERYGSGYKIINRDGLKKAIDDLGDVLVKGLGDNDMIKALTDEINSCQKIYVTNGKITDVLLVKAYTAEEIEKAQKADLEKGGENKGDDNLEKAAKDDDEDLDDDKDDDLKKASKKDMKKSEEDEETTED